MDWSRVKVGVSQTFPWHPQGLVEDVGIPDAEEKVLSRIADWIARVEGQNRRRASLDGSLQLTFISTR